MQGIFLTRDYERLGEGARGWEMAGEVGIERLGLCICRAYSLQETTRGWERMREARKGRERLELKGWGCAYAGHIPYKRLREAGRGCERLGKGGRGWN
jgi:hypothetical protein